MLLEIYLITVKCYTAPRYIHVIWNINLLKLPKCRCCHVWHLRLVKVKVTIESFLLHLSRSVYFVTYPSTSRINFVIIFNFKQTSSCAPLLQFCWVGWGGWGGLSLQLNFQKGGRWQGHSSQILGSQKVVAGKDRGDIFQWGCRFYININWNRKYLTTEKVYKQKMFLSFITKSLNWEIFTKNLVTFKIWDGNKDEHFNTMQVY